MGDLRPSTVLSRLRSARLAMVFVTLVCLSILGIEAWRIEAARSAQIAESNVAVSNLAKSLAEHASGTFTQADAVLTGIVERIEVDGLGPKQIERLHRILQTELPHLPQLQRLSVIDSRGMRLVTDLDGGMPGPANADREYFAYHKASAGTGPHLGPPIKARSTGEWIVTISRRFNKSDGSFGGVVLASIRLAFFDAHYAKLDIGEEGSILLAMRDGTILERRPFREDVVGRNFQGPLFRDHIAYDEAGTMWNKSAIDGVQRLIGFQKLDRFPAYAVVALSKDDILRSWAWDATVHASTAVLLALLLGIVGAKLVAQTTRRHGDQMTLLKSRSELETLNTRLASLAREDGLTGLANRREFDRFIDVETKRVDRSGGSLALLLLDIDCFKKFNDRFGHQAGDECLRRVADEIQDCVRRPSDLAARYGGEEFALLLPSTDLAGALVIAERLRGSIQRCALANPASDHGVVTASIGVSVLTGPDCAGNAHALLREADRALYRAKACGRNCVEVAGAVGADVAAPMPASVVADREPACLDA